MLLQLGFRHLKPIIKEVLPSSDKSPLTFNDGFDKLFSISITKYAITVVLWASFDGVNCVVKKVHYKTLIYEMLTWACAYYGDAPFPFRISSNM